MRVRHTFASYQPRASETHSVKSNSINALSFSHDGEFIAIANAGNYIDIVRVFPTIPVSKCA